jgi:putative spermidine/putrescine transport system ATP-binding protein
MTGLIEAKVRESCLDAPETGAEGLSLSGVGKKYGSEWVVREVDLEIPRGSFTCFVGPSGCGKTTLLRALAGLLPLDGGRVSWLGQDITDRPAETRNIGMVFQSAALFPHLSVGQNIGYGMKLRRQSRHAMAARVTELLEWVKLPGLEDRAVGTLSGGQRQRVAIARALAIEPDLFLLDEPFSALDAPLREALQVEIAALQRRLGITTILVTHDRQEALSLADHLVVMDRGRIQQAGPPEELYRKPANRFVAQFLGGANLLPAVADQGGVICGGERWEVGSARLAGFADGEPLTVAFRPEQARWTVAMPTGPNRFPAQVVFLRSSGNDLQAHLTFGGGQLRVGLDPRDEAAGRPQMGEQGWLSIAPEQIWVYPAETNP